MDVKKILIVLSLLVGSAVALPAFSADLKCNLNDKAGGQVIGNGTNRCGGLDFSFGASTSGSWENSKYYKIYRLCELD